MYAKSSLFAIMPDQALTEVIDVLMVEKMLVEAGAIAMTLDRYNLLVREMEIAQTQLAHRLSVRGLLYGKSATL